MLLDVDGTLVDSNDSHAQSWVRAFAEAGMSVAFERVRPLMGMGGDKLLPEIDPALDSDREPGKTIAKRRGEIFKERFLEAIEPTPGARDLLLTLRRMKVRCVVATSAKSDELQMLLQRIDAADLIDDATTTEDAEKSKPSPDIVSAALEKAGAEPGATLMLGDTRFDIEAARKAGVATIGLRCGGSSERDLAGAIAIFDDPAALDRHLRAG
ncbi:MAG: HAD family hydrolase [Candidatus Eremiobacteraeota bacterium]|nr:HAD family hydrolase [Candidatus Eremiobacteraeota bacterium]